MRGTVSLWKLALPASVWILSGCPSASDGEPAGQTAAKAGSADPGVSQSVESELVFWGFDPSKVKAAVRSALAGAKAEVHEQLVMRFAHAQLQERKIEAKNVTEYMLDFPKRYYDDELAPVLVNYWEKKLGEGAYDEELRPQVEEALEQTREKMKPMMVEHLRVQAQQEARLAAAETEEEKEGLRTDLKELQSDLGRWFHDVVDTEEIYDSAVSAVDRLKLLFERSDAAPTEADQAALAQIEAQKQRARRDAAIDRIESEPVTFSSGAAALTSDARSALEPVADLMKSAPELRLQVDGYSDSVGSRSLNKGLSRRRATAVVNALADRGVARDRLAAQGYGEARPRAPNSTSQGRALNRRAELKVIRPPEPEPEPLAATAPAQITADAMDAEAGGAAAAASKAAAPQAAVTTPRPASPQAAPSRDETSKPPEAGVPAADRPASPASPPPASPAVATRSPAPAPSPDRSAAAVAAERPAAESSARTAVRPSSPPRTEITRASAGPSGAAAGASKPPSVGHLKKYVKPWLKTPYLFGCKDPSRGGIDCSGFVAGVFRKAYGIELPNSSQLQAKGGTRVRRKRDLRTGDLLFFDVPRRGRVTHVAIYVEDGIMAHASSSRGVVYDKMESSYWTPRYHSARRYLK